MNENPIVEQYYIARYSDLMNTTFSCDFMLHVLDSMVDVMDTEMPKQIQRWGGNYTTWQNRVQTLRNWITSRCVNLVEGMIDCYDLTGPYVLKIEVFPAGAGQIKMNSDLITSFGAVRNVFGGIETILEAIPQGNYQFSHWTFNNTVVTDPNELLQLIDFDSNNEVEAHFIDLTETENQLIYYWHFNNLELVNDTPVNAILADYQLFPNANATMTYTGGDPNMDPVNDGSLQNLQLGEEAGKAVRVRNPSDGRAILFNLPTTDLEEVKFLFSVKRTNQGQLINNISYSIDGTNFITANLNTTVVNITTDYQLISVDFSAIPQVNDNPNFHIRVEFEGNTTQSNGNNRYDNISLTGKIIQDPGVSIAKNPDFEFTVYPNPSSSNFLVSATENIRAYQVIDMLGKTIIQAKTMDTNTFEIFSKHFAPGVYILELTTDMGTVQSRIIKQ
jgi:hypothetical protein